MKKNYGNLALSLYVVAVLVFIFGPLVIVVGISFNPTKILAFPPTGFSLRWYQDVLGNMYFINAILLSLLIAGLTAVISTLIGLLTAQGVTRYDFKGKQFFEAMLLGPITMPSLLLGMSLLVLLAPTKLIGTIYPLILGLVLHTFPYATRIISSAFPGIDIAYEEVATVLGASKPYTFFKIIIPLIKPAIISSALFAFVLSFTDTSIVLFLTTSRLEPIGIAIFRYLYTGQDPGIAALSTLFIVLAIAIVYIVGKLVKLDILI